MFGKLQRLVIVVALSVGAVTGTAIVSSKALVATTPSSFSDRWSAVQDAIDTGMFR